MSLLSSIALQVPGIRRLRDGRDQLLSQQAELVAERTRMHAEMNALREALTEAETRLLPVVESASALTQRESDTIEAIQLISLLTKINKPVPGGLFGSAAQTGQLVQALHELFASIGYPLAPPEALQRRVVGGFVHQFVDSGFEAINDFNAPLARYAGRTIGDFAHVFDFGVGCGRVIRRMAEAYPNMRRTGGDIDAEAIAWLNANYGEYGDFVTLPHRPACSIADGTFDLVYGISVFTHLPEDMQFEWLEELRRITMPGAFLLLSVHGENYLRLFPQAAQDKAAAQGGFFYNDDAGLTSGLPEFYKNTYHTKEYIAKRWTEYFDILDHLPLGLSGHQDLVVCRRR